MTPRTPAAARLGLTLTSLPASRQTILLELKKRGQATTEELAHELEMTLSGIRQHLAAMVAQGMLEYQEVRGATGRPKHVYRLAPATEQLFPRRYSDLTNDFLQYAADEDPEIVQHMFDRRRDDRIERARRRVEGRSFEEKVAELASILDEDGYLAEFEDLGEGLFRVTEHNCAITGVAQRWPLACTTELDFLQQTIPEADIRRVAHMLGGSHVCAYEIRRRDER